MVWPADDRQIPVFFEISSANWCVCGAPVQLNIRLLTTSNFPMFISCCYLTACQLTDGCFKFLAGTKDCALYCCYVENLCELLCSISLSAYTCKSKFCLLYWTAYLQIWLWCLTYAVFAASKNCKANKCEVWCKILNAFRS